MEMEIKLAYEETKEVQKLFSEYTQMLVESDTEFADYLKIQGYDAELLHLTEKYGLPYGRLYLANVDGNAAGCIGLRRMDEESCEMKRLYVRPEYRGQRIAHKLVEKLIEEAKKIGYRTMLLDTAPFLQETIHLYRNFGFYEVECYNNSPVEGTVYMKLD